jgi:hypothetical protein
MTSRMQISAPVLRAAPPSSERLAAALGRVAYVGSLRFVAAWRDRLASRSRKVCSI